MAGGAETGQRERGGGGEGKWGVLAALSTQTKSRATHSTLPRLLRVPRRAGYTSTTSAFAAVLLMDWIPFLQAALVV